MSLPTSDLQYSTEKAISFIEWLVEQFRKKRWIKLLVLFGTAIFLFGNPEVLVRLYGFFQGDRYFNDYPISSDYWIYWLAICFAIFLLVFVITYFTRPKTTLPNLTLSEHSGIRGLIAFSLDDAELFWKLGRSRKICEIVLAVSDHNFRFGILSGESGCGKSSLLQAGIWPSLAKKQYQIIYVHCNELQPLESIRCAVVREIFNISYNQLQNLNLLQLLNFVASHIQQPGSSIKLILILDQFEQFFIHQSFKEDRKPFIKALQEWYQQHNYSAKILISLRSDMYGRMIELTNELGSSPGPSRDFMLDKFEPNEASEVFKTMLKQENIEYDEDFIIKMCANDLSNSQGGLISPVDLQVLALMIVGQNAFDRRRFDRSSFQRLGGFEGLLNRYLERILKYRDTEERRQSTIKVLLALTDLDNNIRVGVLTESELQQKLATNLSSVEINEALQWLIRPDVRLITLRPKGDEQGFELVHDRIIAAIRRLADKTLTEMDQANLLLQRRTNEWFGNDRSPRFLLNWRDYRQIMKQEPYLTWQPNKFHKEELISCSRRRYRNRVVGIMGFILLFGAVYKLNHLSQVQLWRVKQELLEISGKVRQREIQEKLAQVLVASGSLDQAIEVARRIENKIDRERAFRLLVQSTIKQIAIESDEQTKAAKLLDKAVMAADEIKGYRDRAGIFQSLVKMAIELNDLGKAVELLDEVQFAAEKIKNGKFKAQILGSLARSAIKLNDPAKAAKLLENAEMTAEEIEGYWDRAEIFESLAKIAIELNDSDKAFKLFEKVQMAAEKMESDESKAIIFEPLVKSAIELKDPAKAAELLDDVQFTAEKIKNGKFKAQILESLARSAIKLNDPAKAAKLLENAEMTAEEIEDYGDRAEIFVSLAKIAIELNDSDKAFKLFENAEMAAEEIEDYGDRAEIFVSLAKITIELNDSDKAFKLFEKMQMIAEKMESNRPTARIFGSLVRSAIELFDRTKSTEFLDKVLRVTENIKDPGKRMHVLQSLIRSAIELKDPANAFKLFEKVQMIAEKMESDRSKARIFESLARSTIKLNDPAKAAKLLENAEMAAEDIENYVYRLDIFESLAKIAIELNDSDKAFKLFEKVQMVAEKMESDESKARIFKSLVRNAIELKDPAKAAELLDGVQFAAEKIKNGKFKAQILESLARSAIKLNDPAKAAKLLENAEMTAEEIEGYWDRAEIFESLAKIAIELNDSDKAFKLFEKVQMAAEKMERDWSKARIFKSLVRNAIELNEPVKAAELLDKVRVAVDKIRVNDSKAELLKLMIRITNDPSYSIDKTMKSLWLNNLFNSVLKVSDSTTRDFVLVVLTEHTAMLENWSKAREFADKVDSKSMRIVALIHIFHASYADSELRLNLQSNCDPNTSFGVKKDKFFCY
jgi:galactitol-specific phosphotransferase system IIB component